MKENELLTMESANLYVQSFELGIACFDYNLEFKS